jgi:hypothetical protein
MSALLWPLFVAACEAATPGDRALAERAFVEVERRQGMRNIERAWGIVREVWRRRRNGTTMMAARTSGVGGRERKGRADGGVVLGEGREELLRPGEAGEGVVVVTVEEQGGRARVVEEVDFLEEDEEEGESVVNVGGVVLGGEEIWRRVCREMGVSIVFG